MFCSKKKSVYWNVLVGFAPATMPLGVKFMIVRCGVFRGPFQSRVIAQQSAGVPRFLCAVLGLNMLRGLCGSRPYSMQILVVVMSTGTVPKYRSAVLNGQTNSCPDPRARASDVRNRDLSNLPTHVMTILNFVVKIVPIPGNQVCPFRSLINHIILASILIGVVKVSLCYQSTKVRTCHVPGFFL
jgi:hypothetical protein